MRQLTIVPKSTTRPAPTITETWEVRTKAGAVVSSYDQAWRARKALGQHEARIGIRLQLFKITHTEQQV